MPVGKIVGSFGYKGELKIIPYDSWPKEIYFDNIYACINENFELLSIDSLRIHNKFYLIMFKNCAPEKTDFLINKELWLDKKNTATLEKGEYYLEDLSGLSVYNQKGSPIGILENIMKIDNGHDIFVIKKESKEYLIPALSRFIVDIDLSKRRIKVNTSELYE